MKLARIFFVVFMLVLFCQPAFAESHLTGNEYDEPAPAHYEGYQVIRGHKYNADVYFKNDNSGLHKLIKVNDGKDPNEIITWVDLSGNTRKNTRSEIYDFIGQYNSGTRDRTLMRKIFGSVDEDRFNMLAVTTKCEEMIDEYLALKKYGKNTSTLADILAGVWQYPRDTDKKLVAQYDGTNVTGTISSDFDFPSRNTVTYDFKGKVISDKKAELTLYKLGTSEIIGTATLELSSKPGSVSLQFDYKIGYKQGGMPLVRK